MTEETCGAVPCPRSHVPPGATAGRRAGQTARQLTEDCRDLVLRKFPPRPRPGATPFETAALNGSYREAMQLSVFGEDEEELPEDAWDTHRASAVSCVRIVATDASRSSGRQVRQTVRII